MSAVRAHKFPTSTQRKNLLARVHIAKKEMGLSDPVYRDSIGAVVPGANSAAQLNNQQLNMLLNHFKAHGWKPQKPKPKSNGYRQRSERAMVRKIYVLWSILYENGRVEVKYPDGYVARMTKRADRPEGVRNPEDLEDDEAYAIIESLKKWIMRADLGHLLVD